MSLFKPKKPKAKEFKTIQEVQAEFNTVIFNIGRAKYQLHMIQQSIEQARVRDESPLLKEIKTLQDRADELGRIGQQLGQKAQEEVMAKVREGQTDEALSAPPAKA